MKVIKRGTIPSEKVYIGNCSHCLSLVEATHKELTHSYSHRGVVHVGDCPVCTVGSIYFGESA